MKNVALPNRNLNIREYFGERLHLCANFDWEMNSQNFQLAKSFVHESYVKQAEQSRKGREKLIRKLLSNRKLSKDGWW